SQREVERRGGAGPEARAERRRHGEVGEEGDGPRPGAGGRRTASHTDGSPKVRSPGRPGRAATPVTLPPPPPHPPSALLPPPPRAGRGRVRNPPRPRRCSTR